MVLHASCYLGDSDSMRLHKHAPKLVAELHIHAHACVGYIHIHAYMYIHIHVARMIQRVHQRQYYVCRDIKLVIIISLLLVSHHPPTHHPSLYVYAEPQRGSHQYISHLPTNDKGTSTFGTNNCLHNVLSVSLPSFLQTPDIPITVSVLRKSISCDAHIIPHTVVHVHVELLKGRLFRILSLYKCTLVYVAR